VANFIDYDFNNGASNGTNLTSYTRGGSEVGSGWTIHPSSGIFGTGTLILANNRVRVGSAPACYYENTDCSIDDVTVTATWRCLTDATTANLYARLNVPVSGNTVNAYEFQYRVFHGFKLFKVAVGGITQVDSTIGVFMAANTTYLSTMEVTGTTTTTVNCYVQRQSDSQWLTSGGTYQSTRVACFSYSDTTSPVYGSSQRKVAAEITGGSDSTGVHLDAITAAPLTLPLVAGTASDGGHTYNSATVSWTAATGGASPVTAQLQRSASGANSWSNVSGATSSPAIDSGRSLGTTYDYRVLYTDAASATVTSNTVSITTDSAPPSLVAGSLSSPSHTHNSATVSWTAASGGVPSITSQLQRSAAGANSWSNVSGGTSSPITNTGLSRGTSYDYRVVYTDSYSTPQTATSNTVTVTTDASPSGAEVTMTRGGVDVLSGDTYDFGTVLQESSNSVTLTLTNTGSQSLVIGTLSVTTGTSITTNPSGSTVGVSGTATAVIALSTASAGTISSTLSIPSNDPAAPFTVVFTAVVSPIYPPGTPTGLSGSSTTGSSAELAWTLADATDTGVKIQRSTDNVTFTTLTTTSAHAVAYTDSTVSGATTYYYRVKATNANGDSSASSVVRVDTPVPGAPQAPTNFTATLQTDTDLNLMWDRTDETETYFEIQRSSDSGVTWKSLPQIGARENTINDNSVYPSTTYKYRIRGVNVAGNGAFSSVISVTTAASGASLAAITGLTVTAVDSWKATVSWTDSNSGTTAQVERSFDGINFTPVSLLQFSNGGAFTDHYLPAGTTVYYRVRSLTSGGSRTAWTAPVGVVLPARPVGSPVEAGTICTNTYGVAVGGSASGTFTLTVNTVDYARQPASATTANLPYNATAAQVQASLRALNILPYGSQVYVGGTANNWIVGFTDQYSVLVAGSSSLTGGSLTVTEKMTATNTTLLFADSNGSGTTYTVERSPMNYGYFTFTTHGTVGGDSTGAVAYNLTTTAETNCYVRVRASNLGGVSGYALHIRVVSPSAGSALSIDIGPGQTYAHHGLFDWTTVGPGSTIRIHANTDGNGAATAYSQLLMISCRGTPGKPITVLGVNGGNSNVPPIIDGTNGVYDNSLGNNQFKPNYLGSGSPTDPGFQGHCVLFCRRSGQAGGYNPGYVILKNFTLRKCYKGYTSFTGWGQSGSYPATLTYANASCGVYFAHGDYITIDGNTITDNGQGIFGAGGHNDPVPYTDNRSITNLTIQFNNVSGNGVANSFLEHNTYLEGVSTYYVGNKYGALRALALGSHGIKDRGSGSTFLYNWIGDGVGHSLDIVETQNYLNVVYYDPGYRTTLVMGNVFTMTTVPQDFIHYASDGGVTAWQRKGVVYCMYNTFLLNTFSFKTMIVKNMDNNSTDPCAVVDARNNIFWYTSTSGGLNLVATNGIGYFGKNWITKGYTTGYGGIAALYVGGLSNLIDGGNGNDPGFVNRAAADYHLGSSSACRDVAASIPVPLSNRFVLNRQYLEPTSSTLRPAAGGIYDLGAFEYFTGTMTADVSTVERGAVGTTVTLTGSGTSFTGTPFSAQDQSGNVVSLTSQSVTDGTHASVTFTVPSATGRVTIVDSGSGAAVTLTVRDTTAPTISTAVVGSTGSSLVLTFSEGVQGLYAADFTFASLSSRTLGTPTGSGTTWSFPLSPKGFQGEVYTVSYSGTRVADLYGNALLPLSGVTVTNQSSVAADYIAPNVPAGLTVTPGEGTNVLNWSANSEVDLAGYKVYRNNLLIGSVTAPTRTYTDLGLTSGVSYPYKVTAVDQNLNESSASSIVSGTPLYPTSPVASVAVLGVNITWSAVSVANGPAVYNVEGSDNGGTSWTQLATGLTTTSYFDSSGTSSRKYRIRSQDTVGNLAPPLSAVKIPTGGVFCSRQLASRGGR
jgi:hypothetical protein